MGMPDLVATWRRLCTWLRSSSRTASSTLKMNQRQHARSISHQITTRRVENCKANLEHEDMYSLVCTCADQLSFLFVSYRHFRLSSCVIEQHVFLPMESGKK